MISPIPIRLLLSKSGHATYTVSHAQYSSCPSKGGTQPVEGDISPSSKLLPDEPHDDHSQFDVVLFIVRTNGNHESLIF